MEHWSDFFPIVFFPFKILVLAIGMYYAIKWHADQDDKQRDEVRERKRASESSE